MIRLLQNPHHRQKPADSTTEKSEAPGTKSKTPTPDGTPTGTPVSTPRDPTADCQDIKSRPAEDAAINTSFYNMVCYGLPNLVVTQLTKL